jgi:hypothetical protein
MAKTVFFDIPPLGTIVTALFLNLMNKHRHTGRDIDGDGVLDFAVSGGSDNAYTVALSPALDAYITGMPIIFKADRTNTGAATLAVSGMAAKTIKKNGSSALAANDILIGMIIIAVYDGNDFQVINLGPVSATGQAPVGAEVFWPTETPPTGWLEENGAAISRTTYAALFAAIGVMYGSGNGGTTFNLPDARGRFPRVWDHAAAVDPDRAARTNRGDGTTGDHVGTNQVDAFKSHVHYVNGTGGHDEMYGGSGFAGDGNIAGANTNAAGGSETRPINTNRMLIIKY